MAPPLIRARPTMYRGTQMRSRLEARVAGQLDEAAIEWSYEPQCFADGARQYLPDFHVTDLLYVIPPIGGLDFTCAREEAYLEIKPVRDTLTEALPRAASIVHASVPDVLVVGWAPDSNGAGLCVRVDDDLLITFWGWLRVVTHRKILMFGCEGFLTTHDPTTGDITNGRAF